MAIDPDSLEPGKCYLANDGQVRRVVEIIDDNVNYELRSAREGEDWRPGPPLSSRLTRVQFAAEIDREIQSPCE
ncbi:MAG: hypothetical protein K2X54_18280 [Methylobacterium organophilum]|nr:hypothetical protein [Methylobacterium organophilum]